MQLSAQPPSSRAGSGEPEGVGNEKLNAAAQPGPALGWGGVKGLVFSCLVSINETLLNMKESETGFIVR